MLVVKCGESLICLSNSTGVGHHSGDVSPPGDCKTPLWSNISGRRREAVSLTVCISERSISQSSHVVGERPVATAGRVCVFMCVCLRVVGWGGGVLVLPRQQPRLCNIIWCAVNKEHPAMCTIPPFISAVGNLWKQTFCSNQCTAVRLKTAACLSEALLH